MWRDTIFFFINITMSVYHGHKNHRWSPSKNNHTLNNMCWCRPYCMPLSHQWKSYVYQHNKNKCGATPFSFICANIGVYHGYENQRWSPSKTNLILNDMCGCRPHFIPLSHQWKSQVDQHDKKGCWATPFFFHKHQHWCTKMLRIARARAFLALHYGQK